MAPPINAAALLARIAATADDAEAAEVASDWIATIVELSAARLETAAQAPAALAPPAVEWSEDQRRAVRDALRTLAFRLRMTKPAGWRPTDRRR